MSSVSTARRLFARSKQNPINNSLHPVTYTIRTHTRQQALTHTLTHAHSDIYRDTHTHARTAPYACQSGPMFEVSCNTQPAEHNGSLSLFVRSQQDRFGQQLFDREKCCHRALLKTANYRNQIVIIGNRFVIPAARQILLVLQRIYEHYSVSVRSISRKLPGSLN